MRRLAEALKERQGDQSLRAVARELGVATGTAEGWLKAWRKPEYNHLPRLAGYLGVPVDEIIRWILEDEPPIIYVTPWFPRPIDAPTAA